VHSLGTIESALNASDNKSTESAWSPRGPLPCFEVNALKMSKRFSPVADEAGVALIDGDGGLWVHVKADEDSSQEVTSRWTQCSHHVHDG